jgi:hypothetical protein
VRFNSDFPGNGFSDAFWRQFFSRNIKREKMKQKTTITSYFPVGTVGPVGRRLWHPTGKWIAQGMEGEKMLQMLEEGDKEAR